MLERIKKILLYYTDAAKITETSELAGDLGLSSFDMASIVNDFEREFGIEINDRDIRRFVSVGDIIAYLEER